MAAIIHKGRHYTACVHDKSLIVTRNRHGGGKQLCGPQGLEWADAIATAIDSQEAEALCRAIINS